MKTINISLALLFIIVISSFSGFGQADTASRRHELLEFVLSFKEDAYTSKLLHLAVARAYESLGHHGRARELFPKLNDLDNKKTFLRHMITSHASKNADDWQWIETQVGKLIDEYQKKKEYSPAMDFIRAYDFIGQQENRGRPLEFLCQECRSVFLDFSSISLQSQLAPPFRIAPVISLRWRQSQRPYFQSSLKVWRIPCIASFVKNPLRTRHPCGSRHWE